MSQKISLYSVNDLKSTTDDALAPYLTRLPAPYKFTQTHTKTDTRLAVGYAAVAVAAALFYADWKLGWDATKAYTAPACVAYFLLNGFLTYWIWAVEGGTVFVGVREGGQKLTLKSSSKKNTPVYKLHIKYEAPSGQVWEDREIQGNFTEWFHAKGYLEHKALRQWLARNIEVIGLADLENKKIAEETYAGVIEDRASAAVVTGVDTPKTAKKAKNKA